jgi:hypothetical protein
MKEATGPCGYLEAKAFACTGSPKHRDVPSGCRRRACLKLPLSEVCLIASAVLSNQPIETLRRLDVKAKKPEGKQKMCGGEHALPMAWKGLAALRNFRGECRICKLRTHVPTGHQPVPDVFRTLCNGQTHVWN